MMTETRKIYLVHVYRGILKARERKTWKTTGFMMAEVWDRGCFNQADQREANEKRIRNLTITL